MLGPDLSFHDDYVANLSWADLSKTSMRNQYVNMFTLKGVDLSEADLRNVHFSQVDLRWARMSGVDLSGKSKLSEVNLSGADLTDAKLSGATLSYDVDLVGTILKNTDLSHADLTYRVTLENAKFIGTNLEGADLSTADVTGATFEPNAEKLPSIRSMARMVGLDQLRFDEPDVILALRNGFREGGYEAQERRMTYALQKRLNEKRCNGTETRKPKKKCKEEERGWIERKLNWALFDVPSKYGMEPGRPLQLMLLLFGVSGCVYFGALIAGTIRERWRRIWAAWPDTAVQAPESRTEPQGVTPDFFYSFRSRSCWRRRLWLGFLMGAWVGLFIALGVTFWWSDKSPIYIGLAVALGFSGVSAAWRPFLGAVTGGFYFSLLSALHIGWRDLNVGTWLSRIQPREYTLRATGWVRVVSGVQSIVSVYLIALSILTYFGRPFG